MEKINNDCNNCKYCIKHFIQVDGQYEQIDKKVYCSNSKMSKRERQKRANNQIVCEYFQVPQSTELENIVYSVCGIMSELYEIKQILKEKLVNQKTNDHTE